MADAPLLKSIEARAAPRFVVRLEGQVVADSDVRCSARVTNLSHSGLRLEGTREMVDTVLPNQGGGEVQRRQASVEVTFFLGEGRGDAVVVRCQSVYVRRLDQDWFQMGLLYTRIEPAFQGMLEDFIRRQG